VREPAKLEPAITAPVGAAAIGPGPPAVPPPERDLRCDSVAGIPPEAIA
jgi:hypothetical protein